MKTDQEKFDKAAYQKEYMRKKREAEKLEKAGVWDEKEFPDRETWDIAVGRAYRAREYARKQPDKIGGGEERFQDIGWQYKQVKGRKAEGFVPEWVSDDPNPAFPWLKKHANREYNAQGLVMKKQRCEACGNTWGASVEMECPYCHGKGKKVA